MRGNYTGYVNCSQQSIRQFLNNEAKILIIVFLPFNGSANGKMGLSLYCILQKYY